MPIPYSKEVFRCPGCGEPLIAVPILACADCGKARPLRAFAHKRRDGGFIAECVDLDLLSQGETVEEAIVRLQEAMAAHLEAAFSGPSTRGLVLRPSPWTHRLHYRWHCFLDRLSGIFSRRHRSHLLPYTEETARVRLSHC